MTNHTQSPEQHANFRNLYADIIWYGILAGSTLAFLMIYVTRLGASSLQVSLISSGPAVINLLFSPLAGRWLENRALIPVSFWSAAFFRFGYFAIIPLAWFFTNESQITSVIIITLVMSVPGTVLAISFNALFADIVPPDWRGQVVGKRNAFLAVSLTATTLACGLILDKMVFPLNYQVVFGLGALGGAMSTYYISRLHQSGSIPPQRVNRPIGDLARPGTLRFGDAFRLPVGLRFLTRSAGLRLLRLDLLKGRMGRFMFAYLVFYIFQYTPLPLFPLASVRHLHLTDGQISLGSALFYISMMLISVRLGSLSNKIGHRNMLVISSLGYGIYPLLFGLAKDVSLYWVASLIGGIFWAILSASLVNRLMEVVSEEHRPAYMALHNMVLNLGILAGVMIAPVLAVMMSLPDTLLVSAILRTVAGLILFLWG